jgi:hypothetical protein
MFSDHNLVTNAVFGEMNLISCRSVMIYFGRPLQDRRWSPQRINDRKGFLGLGAKESLRFSAHTSSFSDHVREEKIYQRSGRLASRFRRRSESVHPPALWKRCRLSCRRCAPISGYRLSWSYIFRLTIEVCWQSCSPPNAH